MSSKSKHANTGRPIPRIANTGHPRAGHSEEGSSESEHRKRVSSMRKNKGEEPRKINDFAERHRLTLSIDPGDSTEVLVGSQGHIYEYDHDTLAVIFSPAGAPRTRLWRALREKCLAAGMKLRQNGDAEGSLSFDPGDRSQAKLAIKVAGIRTRRKSSEGQLANLVRGNRFQSALFPTTETSLAS